MDERGLSNGDDRAVESCENHHERVAEALRRRAARHSGTVTGDRPDS